MFHNVRRSSDFHSIFGNPRSRVRSRAHVSPFEAMFGTPTNRKRPRTSHRTRPQTTRTRPQTAHARPRARTQFETDNNPDAKSRWVRRRHPQNGELYYYDRATGDASWEMPRELARLLRNHKVAEEEAEMTAVRSRTPSPSSPPASAPAPPAPSADDAATSIQAAYRGWATRRLCIVDSLRTLRKFERVAMELATEYGPKLEDERATSLEARAYGEFLMQRVLFGLDSVPTRGSVLVRSRRKELVVKVNIVIASADAYAAKIDLEVAAESVVSMDVDNKSCNDSCSEPCNEPVTNVESEDIESADAEESESQSESEETEPWSEAESDSESSGAASSSSSFSSSSSSNEETLDPNAFYILRTRKEL